MKRLLSISPRLISGSAMCVGAISLGNRRKEPTSASTKPIGLMRVDPDFGLKVTLVHGTLYPPFMKESVVDKLMNEFVLRESDVVVLSYPKCGTTWMQKIMLELVEAPGARQPSASPWIERAMSEGKTSMEQLDALPPRRVLKTHAPVKLFPAKDTSGAKIVLVARSPEDALVSYWHQLSALKGLDYCGDINHFFKLFIAGLVPHGSYFDWHAEWGEKALKDGGKQIIVTTYEDLKKNPEREISRLAAHIGVHLTPERLKEIVQKTSFASMKEDATKPGGHDFILSKQYKDGSTSFYRKGEVGDGTRNLTPDQLEQLHRAARVKLACTVFPYGRDN